MAAVFKTQPQPQILVVGLLPENILEVSWNEKYFFCQNPSQVFEYDLKSFSWVILVDIEQENFEKIIGILRKLKTSFVRLTDGYCGLLNWVTKNDLPTLITHRQNIPGKLERLYLTYCPIQTEEDKLRAKIHLLNEQINALRASNLELYQKKITLLNRLGSK